MPWNCDHNQGEEDTHNCKSFLMTLHSNFLFFLPLPPLPGCCRGCSVAKSLSHVWLFVTRGLYFFKSTAPWTVGALQCCINFHCTAKWLSYTHTCTHTHTYIHSFSYFFHYGLSQDIEYSSLCYTVGPCSVCNSVCTSVCTYILYEIGFFCSPSDSQSIPAPPHLGTTSLFCCPWVCFCFVDRFICVIFSILHISDTGCTFKIETIETTGSDDILDIGYGRRKESRTYQGSWLCKLEEWSMDLDVIWEFGSTKILYLYLMALIPGQNHSIYVSPQVYTGWPW